MAVLPFLLQAKAGACQHTDFVEFISVSITLSAITAVHLGSVLIKCETLSDW